MRNLWLIECKQRDYNTTCFDTKKEAIYRLDEMAKDNFYNCGLQIIKRANDFFQLSDGAIFRVINYQTWNMSK